MDNEDRDEMPEYEDDFIDENIEEKDSKVNELWKRIDLLEKTI